VNFVVDLTYQRVIGREPKFRHDVIDDLSDMVVVLEVVEATARMGGGVHYPDDIGCLFAIGYLVLHSTISRPLARSRSVICLAWGAHSSYCLMGLPMLSTERVITVALAWQFFTRHGD
jgi:hypothetical protein